MLSCCIENTQLSTVWVCVCMWIFVFVCACLLSTRPTCKRCTSQVCMCVTNKSGHDGWMDGWMPPAAPYHVLILLPRHITRAVS